jgi:hypothetical protein
MVISKTYPSPGTKIGSWDIFEITISISEDTFMMVLPLLVTTKQQVKFVLN